MIKLKKLFNNVTQLHVGSDRTVVFSYETPVLAWVSGRGWLVTNRKFSKTTSKHINKLMASVPNYTLVDQSEIESVLG